MNKKISTRTGSITAMLILSLVLFLIKVGIAPLSAYHLFQFLILFAGIFTSCLLLHRYYASISFMDCFAHGMRTLATTLVIVIIGNALLYFIFRKPDEPWENLTFMIMKTIFAYSVSGVLSSLLSSVIFNTFTKK